MNEVALTAYEEGMHLVKLVTQSLENDDEDSGRFFALNLAQERFKQMFESLRV